MSDPLWLALITAVPATLAAIGALIVGLRNGRKVDVTQAKVEAVDQKAIEIHTLTNSNLSRVTAALDVANTKIDGLQKQVTLMVGARTVAEDAKTIADQVIRDALPKKPL